MPISPTYPGVYIQEIPSGVRTITGVATSITAFIGRALKGQTDEPVRVQNFSEFTRFFGGLWIESTMSYAVQQYFQHGGTDAIIVRVFNGNQDTDTSTILLPGGTLTLRASSAGLWGDNLRVIVNHQTKDDTDTNLFNLIVSEVAPDSGGTVATETFLNLSVDEDSPRFVRAILEQQSALVRVGAAQAFPTPRPDESVLDAGNPTPTEASGGGEGADITDDDIRGPNAQSNDFGLYALRRADLFNLLCIPPLTREDDGDLDLATIGAAAIFCKEERAMLIVDPRSNWHTVADAEDDGEDDENSQDINAIRAAVGTDASTNVLAYFPRLHLADPLKENRTEEFAPCGAIAGIIARTDAQRGVWKAAAGLEASLSGVRKLSYKMTDLDNGRLNPLGLNCIRSFPVFGNVVWGARTLVGADILASEWKYAPVRRIALFIEESLYRGTQWVVFEPNDEPLWAQIRLNIGAFMQNLFRQGAFQGRTPREAYLVKCDSETTTQNDINLGIVNILVGFAPLKPAEFVIIRIQQLAGQIQT